MARTEEAITSRKKIIGRAGVLFIIVVLFLTFFSKTIHYFLLPTVSYGNPMKGEIKSRISGMGRLEMVNREKIIAEGIWKVEDILVKPGESVKEGQVLAIVSTESDLISGRKNELNIKKQINALEEYKANFRNVTLERLLRDIELAERKVAAAEETLASAQKMYNSGLSSREDLRKAEQDLEDAKYDLKVKKTSLGMEQQKYDRYVEERTEEIEIMKLEYEKAGALPEGGEIKAPFDGVVLSVNVTEGATTMSKQEMFLLGEYASGYKVVWSMDQEKAESLDDKDRVKIDQLEVRKIDKEGNLEPESYMNFDLLIRSKTFNYNTKMVDVTVHIDGRYHIQDGINVSVYVDKKSEEEYACIVSKEYLIKDYSNPAPDAYIIYVLNSKNTVWGVQYFVKKELVEVLEEGDLNAAIDTRFASSRIVSYSSKPLQDGMQVKLR